jgi:hypothetical protein
VLALHGWLVEAADLLEWLVDEEPCHFDHNGSCQAHMWFFPDPGEICPMELTKRWLKEHRP